MSEEPIAASEQSGPGGPEGPPAAAEPPAGQAAPADDATAHDAAERAGEVVEHDLDELTVAQRERDSYLELAQRTKADFDNYRKRVAKETSEALTRGRAELARELVPVLDNLERAVAASGAEPAATAAAADHPSEEVSARDALARGVALVLAELRMTLERAGVEAYDPAGQKFDPAWHEALSTRAGEGVEPGTVVETLERGYRLDGQLLRPARVVVSE